MIAAGQHGVDEEMARRHVWWDEREREQRTLRAGRWREARVRLFALPMRPERTEAILEDLDGGGIPNFHGLKLRLAMALQTSSEAGIVLDRVHRYVVESAGGPAHIAQKTGWPAAEVATIDSYRNSTNTYHFLTEPDSITILTSSGGLRLESRCENVYPLGDRCPVLALRKEAPR